VFLKEKICRFGSALSVALGLCIVSGGAQADEPTPLFASEDLLTLTFEAPFSTLFGSLLNAEEYVEAKMTLDGETVLNVKIRPRGKTRRNPDICKFPPLTVNIKTKSAKGTAFEGQDKLKLVTHCQSRRSRYQDYYRQEYYIYKTYNLVTDESFRVRGATITYIDTDGKKSPVTAFGFFIEDAEALAARTNMTRLKTKKIESKSFNLEKASRFALFQYMIGNLDWATMGGPEGENCCHNSKPFVEPSGKVVSVPYDFDFSGVVDATYASPPQGIELRNIRTRLYRGLCGYNDSLPAAAALLKDRRQAIKDLYESAEVLDEREARKTIRYYDSFYKIVDTPKTFDRRIASKCRK
jgi:hypothetical protein